MIIVFEKPYLRELYQKGKTRDKKYRFQPQIVSKFIRVINLISVRVNDQYRIEFTEAMESGKQIATICNITDLSNHYQ